MGPVLAQLSPCTGEDGREDERGGGHADEKFSNSKQGPPYQPPKPAKEHGFLRMCGGFSFQVRFEFHEKSVSASTQSSWENKIVDIHGKTLAGIL
jgi:hypothetical protein